MVTGGLGKEIGIQNAPQLCTRLCTLFPPESLDFSLKAAPNTELHTRNCSEKNLLLRVQRVARSTCTSESREIPVLVFIYLFSYGNPPDSPAQGKVAKAMVAGKPRNPWVGPLLCHQRNTVPREWADSPLLGRGWELEMPGRLWRMGSWGIVTQYEHPTTLNLVTEKGCYPESCMGGMTRAASGGFWKVNRNRWIGEGWTPGLAPELCRHGSDTRRHTTCWEVNCGINTRSRTGHPVRHSCQKLWWHRTGFGSRADSELVAESQPGSFPVLLSFLKHSL